MFGPDLLPDTKIKMPINIKTITKVRAEFSARTLYRQPFATYPGLCAGAVHEMRIVVACYAIIGATSHAIVGILETGIQGGITMIFKLCA